MKKLIIISLVVLLLGGFGYFIYSNHVTDSNVQNKEITPVVKETSKNSASEQKIKLPTFSDYPINTTTTKPISLPSINLKSNSLGSTFKSEISAVNKTDPDFAGKYSIAIWGCGGGCQMGVLIDRSTGTIIGELPVNMSYGQDSKIDSSLLIINPYTADEDAYREEFPEPTYYFNWNGKTFEHLGAYIITKNSIKKAADVPLE